jgi:nucleotide-binding universal stress UspA family protein
LKRSNAIKLSNSRKMEYELHRTKDSDFTLRDELLVSHGNSISETILEFANKERADLIVMGNTGLSGISKLNIRECI